MQRGLDRAADHQPKAVDHLRRPRQLELSDLLGRHRAVAHLVEVLVRVDERELVPGRRLGLDDVGRAAMTPRLEEAGVNQRDTCGWERRAARYRC